MIMRAEMCIVSLFVESSFRAMFALNFDINFITNDSESDDAILCFIS